MNGSYLRSDLAGGRWLIARDATWSPDKRKSFELTELPKMATVRARLELNEHIKLIRYCNISTVLGVELDHHDYGAGWVD